MHIIGEALEPARIVCGVDVGIAIQIGGAVRVGAAGRPIIPAMTAIAAPPAAIDVHDVEACVAHAVEDIGVRHVAQQAVVVIPQEELKGGPAHRWRLGGARAGATSKYATQHQEY